MYLKILISIVALLINKIHGVIYYLNESEYNRMPPLYKIDDYEVCLQEPRGIYCNVHFNLISETESELLNMIVEYSEQTRTHFNHSQLMYGVCVTGLCQTYIKDLKLISKSSIEACLNDTLMNEYQLMTQVTSLSCHKAGPKAVIDNTDKAAAVILVLILLINIFCSIYDVIYSKKMKENNVLACFSIRRNWKRLICHTSNSNSRTECLKGINGIRCIILLGVIMVHSALPFLIAVQNTHDLELMYYNVRQGVIMSGSLVIQSNILISGFLLAYKIELYSENNTIDWNIIPKALLTRYFRITPVYAVIIAIVATWLKFLGPGQFWQVCESLHLHCRSNWWHNLLYINNYKYNSQCIISTWYLGMDMQFFCLGIVLCIVLREKSWRKPVLSSLLFLGIVVTAVHTYVRDLDAIFILAPQPARTLFVSNRTFNETYKMSHSNMSSFIIGMMLGYLVYKWQETGVDISNNKILRYLYWALVPVGLAVMFTGELFYRDAPRDPLAVRVAYAAVVRPIFATLMAMLIAGTIFKVDNVYRKALEWNIWTIPSRLSYCVFVLHPVIINIFVGLRHSLVVFSSVNVLIFVSEVTLVSFITAVPMWLLVETPFTELVKYYSGKSHQKKQIKDK